MAPARSKGEAGAGALPCTRDASGVAPPRARKAGSSPPAAGRYRAEGPCRWSHLHGHTPRTEAVPRLPAWWASTGLCNPPRLTRLQRGSVPRSCFLDTSPEKRETKAKINYWDHKQSKMCAAKEQIKTKRRPTGVGVYLQRHSRYRAGIQNIERTYTPQQPKPNNPVFKRGEDTDGRFPKKTSRCQQTREKMLSITHQQGNADQNHDELSPDLVPVAKINRRNK